jgi:hypothetical protein
MFGELSSEIYPVADELIVLALFALLKQPTFVALLLKRTLPIGSAHTTRAWVVAVWAWFGSKSFSVVLATKFVIRDWHQMLNWAHSMYIVLWTIIYAIQIWSGCIQMSILKAVRQEQQGEERLLPDAPAKCKQGVDTLEVECLMSSSSSSSSDGSEGGLGLKDCEVQVQVDDQPGGGVKKDC